MFKPPAGISREGDLIDLGVDQGIIKKLGSFFSYGDLRLGQGRDNSRAYLRENPTLAGEIEQAIRQAVGLRSAFDTTDDEAHDGDAAHDKELVEQETS